MKGFRRLPSPFPSFLPFTCKVSDEIDARNEMNTRCHCIPITFAAILPYKSGGLPLNKPFL